MLVMGLPVVIDARFHDAVIFHLDGVVTRTASLQAAVWAAVFDSFLVRRRPDSREDHSLSATTTTGTS